MRKYTLLALLTGVLAIAPLSRADDALYKGLGGKKGITAVVNDFVGRCATDPKIMSFFADDLKNPAQLKKFKMNLVNQICEASGGPCKYTGKDMKTAHAGMGITSGDFDALVGDLVAALDKAGVKPENKNALLGALGPMKKDIVTK